MVPPRIEPRASGLGRQCSATEPQHPPTTTRPSSPYRILIINFYYHQTLHAVIALIILSWSTIARSNQTPNFTIIKTCVQSNKWCDNQITNLSLVACKDSAHNSLLIDLQCLHQHTMDQGTTCCTTRHTISCTLHWRIWYAHCYNAMCAHVNQLVLWNNLWKDRGHIPQVQTHMHNSLNHLLPLTVCMVLTLFLCRRSAPKVSHSSCTRCLWPLRAARRTAVSPFWGRGCKIRRYSKCVLQGRDKEVIEFFKHTKPHWACAKIRVIKRMTEWLSEVIQVHYKPWR